LISTQEDERSRIARDLHDDVSQQLAGVSIMLSSLRRTLRRSAPLEAEAAVAALQERTTSLAEAIRRVSHELHPGTLEHVGLAAALRQHCGEVQRHHGLTVNFTAENDLDELDFPVALCLYRVTQEALTNIVRHARATVASIVLVRVETGVTLHVADDGVGFTAADRSDAGLGLRSIDERVRLVSGAVLVESQPGAGTKLVVEIPLPLTETALA
jgi:signal transduction histidine kinase